MDAITAIERRVEDGFVLDREGRWVHVAELAAFERRTREELERGNVYAAGAWVSIAAALGRVAARNAPATPRSVPTVTDFEPPTQPPPAIPPPPAAILREQTAADDLFEPQDNYLETIVMDAAALAQIGSRVAANAGIGADSAAPNFININTGNAGGIANIDDTAGTGAEDADFTGRDDMRETAVLSVDEVNSPDGEG